ncbi:hypothetical protein Tco_0364079 [Tanacetum coccineum]
MTHIPLRPDLGVLQIGIKSLDFVLSDSENSTVTYTSIYSDYEEPSDVGSPGIVVYGYDGLPMHPPYLDYVLGPEHLPSPDYVPGPEHPPSPVYVPYVSKPAYPEFMQPEDDVFLNEEHLLPAVVSPTADSPGYITESDPEEDPEEDDEDSKEHPAYYLADRDDVDGEESSEDVAGDKEEDEDEEEEEHLASADTVDRLLAIPTLPPSPLTSYSSPLLRIPSPPLPVSPPLHISPPLLPASPTYPLGYRAVTIRLRAESPSTSHTLSLPPPIVLLRTRASMAMMRAAAPSTYCLASRSETPSSGTSPILPIPLPTSSPPLLPPSTDYRADVLNVMLPPWKRLCIAPDHRYKIAKSSFVPTARPTRDRRSHARTAKLMESDARASREAWVQSMDASDTVLSEVRALPTMVLAQQTEIGDL